VRELKPARFSIRSAKGPSQHAGRTRHLYAEAAISSEHDQSATVTLWADGRCGFELRQDGRRVFAFSFYPAAIQTDGRGDAVLIDRGAELVRKEGNA
jgi:hypothetical protein